MLAAVVGLAIAATAPEQNVGWSAPPECPSEAEVRARVAALLAEGGSGRREEVALDMRVTATDDGFELRATATQSDGAQGERVVTGVDCRDVAEAGALIAAIAIDPDLTPTEPEPESPTIPEPAAGTGSGSASTTGPDSTSGSAIEPEPATGPGPEPATGPGSGPGPAPGSGSAPAPAPPRSTPILAADLGLALGRLAQPLPMPYARFGAGFERARFRLLARLSGFGPSFGRADNGPAGGVFGLGAIGIAPCVQSLGTPWRVVGCIATDVGFVGGRGRNTRFDRRTRYAPWWGIEGEVGVEYAIRPSIALALRLDGGGVPVSPNLVIEGQGRVCCVVWGAGLRLGVVGRFGAGD
jgi:hypothetical protein